MSNHNSARQHCRAFLVFCILTGLLSSCVYDIDLTTGEEVLNLYCVLKEGPEQSLELSYVSSGEKDTRRVGDDVVISLFDNGQCVGKFDRVSDTKWTLRYEPSRGHSYRLEAIVPGQNTVSAETTFPFAAGLCEARVLVPGDNKVFGPSGPVYRTGFKMESSHDLVLWCYFEVQSDETSFADFIATDHPEVDGRGETGFDLDTFPQYNSGYSKSRTGILSDCFLQESPVLHNKVLRIAHPANFRRNLASGDIEVLDSYQATGGTTYTVEKETSGVFGLSGIKECTEAGQNHSFELVVNSVSPEYDLYLSDYYYGVTDDDDFTHIVYKRNRYSNVRNGTGIFGASSEYRAGPFPATTF